MYLVSPQYVDKKPQNPAAIENEKTTTTAKADVAQETK